MKKTVIVMLLMILFISIFLMFPVNAKDDSSNAEILINNFIYSYNENEDIMYKYVNSQEIVEYLKENFGNTLKFKINDINVVKTNYYVKVFCIDNDKDIEFIVKKCNDEYKIVNIS